MKYVIFPSSLQKSITTHSHSIERATQIQILGITGKLPGEQAQGCSSKAKLGVGTTFMQSSSLGMQSMSRAMVVAIQGAL